MPPIPVRNLRDSIRSFLPPKVNSIFNAMEWVEDELKRIKSKPKNLKHSIKIHNCFRLLCPTPTLLSAETLIRAHTREIVQRVLDKKDTRLCTWAEILGLLSDSSLKAVPNRSACNLYAITYKECFGNLPDGCERLLNEDEDRWSNELLEDIRRKLYFKDRI